MPRHRVVPAKRAVLMVALIVAAGLALTVGAFRYARRNAAQDFLHAFKDERATQVAALGTYLNARLLFLDDLARHLELSRQPDPEDFRAFVATERQRVEGIQALEWAPLVPAANRSHLEARLRHDHAGLAGLTEWDAQGKLRPAQARPWSCPVTFIEPLQGNQPALGYDLGSNPERRAAIEAARDSGQPRATGPLTLVQEQQFQAGFLIFVPVYAKGLPAGTVAERRAAIRGMVLGVFRTKDLLGAALGPGQGWGLRGELQDLDARWGHGPFHQWNGEAPEGRGLGLASRLLLGPEPMLRSRLGFAGRTWEATFRPTPAFLTGRLQRWVWLIPPVGALLTVLLAALFHLIVQEKVRAERLVQERTQALEESLAQLHQSQKMESLGSLAGGVAHDMNNVLGAILTLASANLDLHPAGSRASQAFGTIAMAASRGAKMVKGLLSFARQGTAEALELNLNALLMEGAQLLAQTTLGTVRIELELAPDLGLTRGDAGALTHAFMNLFVNALEAMDGHGRLILMSRNLDVQWLEVQVVDTGQGMSRAVAERAFDPFFTTKAPGQGTGLGLSIVYNTLKAHGGRIELRSEPGTGTRVIMRFPVACATTPSPEPPRAFTDPCLIDVLLVDDDEFIHMSLGSILELLGHRHQAAWSGEEALAALEAGAHPDVVILDMNMPGLGGAGTLPRLRALCPHLPVLLATGRVDQDALDLVQAHPGVTLLAKPFTSEALQRALMSLYIPRATRA